jgi:hypothetical protein
MNIGKLLVRTLTFIVLVALSTCLIKFFIEQVYSLLTHYYSLPKSEFDVTILSLLASLFLMIMLTLGSNFWKISRAV